MWEPKSVKHIGIYSEFFQLLRESFTVHKNIDLCDKKCMRILSTPIMFTDSEKIVILSVFKFEEINCNSTITQTY